MTISTVVSSELTSLSSLFMLKLFKYLKIATPLGQISHTPSNLLSLLQSPGFISYSCPVISGPVSLLDISLGCWLACPCLGGTHWYPAVPLVQLLTSALDVIYWLHLQPCHLFHNWIHVWLKLLEKLVLILSLGHSHEPRSTWQSECIWYDFLFLEQSTVHTFNNSLGEWMNTWTIFLNLNSVIHSYFY